MATRRLWLPLAAALANIRALDNGFPLPQLGWRSWNNFGINVNASLMLRICAELTNRSRVVNGTPTSLLDLGYADCGVDDGWQHAGAGVDGGYHDAAGNPIVDSTKFPSLSAYVVQLHGLGLRAGFYLNNCWNADKCGGVECFEGNVKLLVNAGFDSIKIDSCSAAKDIALHSALINRTAAKPLQIENCHNGPYFPQPSYRFPPNNPAWCPFNSYRTSTDVESNWAVIFGVNLRQTLPFLEQNLSFSGCFAYADMLEIGVKPGLHPNEYPLPLHEAASHYYAWAIISSPLVLSLDLTDGAAVDAVWPIIANWEAIAVNQAYAGHAGGQLLASNATLTWDNCGNWATCWAPEYEVLYKRLPGGGVAFLVLNHGDGPLAAPVTIAWGAVPGLACAAAGACAVRDLHTHADLGVFAGSWTVPAGALASRSSVFISAAAAPR